MLEGEECCVCPRLGGAWVHVFGVDQIHVDLQQGVPFEHLGVPGMAWQMVGASGARGGRMFFEMAGECSPLSADHISLLSSSEGIESLPGN